MSKRLQKKWQRAKPGFCCRKKLDPDRHETAFPPQNEYLHHVVRGMGPCTKSCRRSDLRSRPFDAREPGVAEASKPGFSRSRKKWHTTPSSSHWWRDSQQRSPMEKVSRGRASCPARPPTWKRPSRRRACRTSRQDTPLAYQKGALLGLRLTRDNPEHRFCCWLKQD
jgi:hypothetical protein